MKVIVIIIGVIILLFILIRASIYNSAIRHGRCPKCGAPILPFSNGRQYGHQCTECEWYEITSDFSVM